MPSIAVTPGNGSFVHEKELVVTAGQDWDRLEQQVEIVCLANPDLNSGRIVSW